MGEDQPNQRMTHGAADETDDSGQAYEPRPRWVIGLMITAAAVAALVLILLLVGGDHGPGRHLGAPDPPVAPERWGLDC